MKQTYEHYGYEIGTEESEWNTDWETDDTELISEIVRDAAHRLKSRIETEFPGIDVNICPGSGRGINHGEITDNMTALEIQDFVNEEYSLCLRDAWSSLDEE